jgi:Transposase
VSYAQVSQDLSVHPTQLRNWVKAFADDPQHAFAGQGQMKPEQLEIARLKREVAKLKAETLGRLAPTETDRPILRHQLNVLQQRTPRRRPHLRWIDRALFIWLYRRWPIRSKGSTPWRRRV